MDDSRLRRSRLYAPGNNPKIIQSVGIFGADCIILDLEDSVSQEEKTAARYLAKYALKELDFGRSERIVRINPLSSVLGKKDLEVTMEGEPDTIFLPKSETSGDIKALDIELKRLEEKYNIKTGKTKIIPLIETAKGIINAYEIASASHRVVAISFGAEDFLSDINGKRTDKGYELLFAKSQIVCAAKAAGVQALDTVYSDFRDEEGLYKRCIEAKNMGFDGKGIIHPNQIDIVHKAFSPTKAEIEEAKQIIAAIEEAKSRGAGVASLNGKMIDKPIEIRARRIMKLAKIIEEDEFQ